MLPPECEGTAAHPPPPPQRGSSAGLSWKEGPPPPLPPRSVPLAATALPHGSCGVQLRCAAPPTPPMSDTPAPPPLHYGYASPEQEERYYHEQEALYAAFAKVPSWVTHQFGFPALPPPGAPGPAAGADPMFYMDAYVRNALALAADAEDLGALEGVALCLGCGLGGALPILKQQMPNAQVRGLELLPALAGVARARQQGTGDVLEGDVYKLQDVVAAGSVRVLYDTVVLARPLEEHQLVSQGVFQMHRALCEGGLLIADVTHHPLYCPMSDVVQRLSPAGLQLVAQRDMNASIVEAAERSEAHMAGCLSDAARADGASVLEAHAAENTFARRSIKQKYVRSVAVFRKGPPAGAAAGGPAPYSDPAEQERYGQGVVSWYEQYELEGRAIPDWVRQLSYPCLPPKGMPQAPEVGVNPHFYLDAFYHRVCSLAATVIDLPAFTGPCLFTGSGLGGMVPILRQHMPRLGRLAAGDIVPFFLQIAQSRGLDRQAELLVLDVLALDRLFAAGEFAMVLDDAIVSHMRNDGSCNAHLFRPAVEQVHRLLAPGGYFLPNGSLKYSTMQTSAAVVADVEAVGFRLLAAEDLTGDCLKACDLMEEHVLGSEARRGCLTDEDKEQYPELMDDVRDSFTEYYRYSMSKGTKGLGHWVFQKV